MNLAGAEATMHRFLDRVDSFVESVGLADEVWPGVRPAPGATCRTHRPPRPARRADRHDPGRDAASVRTTRGCGCRSQTRDGSIRQYRGMTAAPGVYTVGQRFQHRRDSGLIDGARHDAQMVVADLLGTARTARSSRVEAS